MEYIVHLLSVNGKLCQICIYLNIGVGMQQLDSNGWMYILKSNIIAIMFIQ